MNIKEPINKHVSQKDLDLVIKSLTDINNRLSEIGTDIFKTETDKKVLSKPSHFVFSIIHRAIEINRGFLTLSSSNNWITAINLIRLQADNLMRLYALSLVEDRLDFYNKVTNGEHIRNLKDTKGNKLTDFYLSEEIDKIFPGFRGLYQNTSGLIHFSNQHIGFSTDTQNYDNKCTTLFRLSLPWEPQIFEKVDYAYNLFIVAKQLTKLLDGYRSHMVGVLGNF